MFIVRHCLSGQNSRTSNYARAAVSLVGALKFFRKPVKNSLVLHTEIKKEPGLLATEDCEDLPLTVARSVINSAARGLLEEEATDPMGLTSEPKSKANKKRRLDSGGGGSAVLHHIKVEPAIAALTTGSNDQMESVKAASNSSRSGTGRKKVRISL